MNIEQNAISVLIVDDDPDCRALIRTAIADSRLTNTVYEAENGAVALKFLRECSTNGKNPRPTLVFMDVEMPESDGLTTLEAIRSDPALKDVPVIMMTGLDHPACMLKAAELGANSYTVKPASAEAFLANVLEATRYWLTVHQSPSLAKPELHNSNLPAVLLNRS